MTESNPYFVYLDTINVNDVCQFVYGEDSPVNEYLHEAGADSSVLSNVCAGIGVAGIAASGGLASLFFIGAAITCGGTRVGCSAAGFISDSTPCDDVLVDVYVSKHPNALFPHVILILKCDSGYLRKSWARAKATASDIADDLAEESGEAAEEGTDYIPILPQCSCENPFDPPEVI